MLDFDHVLAGVAVVLAVEGICYALFPSHMKRMLDSIAALPEQRLRQGGLVAGVIGVAAAWVLVAL